VSRRRGAPSNHRIAEACKQDILQGIQRYGDFGPTLATEYLLDEGMSVSRETLRHWMSPYISMR
ncbi:MAG: ISNCY family transposase, partial [Methylophilaceae bacterium]|nr:ISNCY family transposase [Methylophilaceae bacterium]